MMEIFFECLTILRNEGYLDSNFEFSDSIDLKIDDIHDIVPLDLVSLGFNPPILRPGRRRKLDKLLQRCQR